MFPLDVLDLLEELRQRIHGLMLIFLLHDGLIHFTLIVEKSDGLLDIEVLDLFVHCVELFRKFHDLLAVFR